MHAHFKQSAAYNQWANARLFEAALSLSETDYRRPVGVFFQSLHGTLNHILLTDRMWLKRITGEGEHPNKLDAILYEDRATLTRSRMQEDMRIVALIDSYALDDFERMITYRNTSGKPFEQKLRDILAHLFNHQTHHRGQAHACLSLLTGREPPSLDLLGLQRGVPAPDLSALLARMK